MKSEGWVHPIRRPEELAPARANPISRATVPKVCRSIWMSDFHLGTRGCKADALLDFLRSHEAENLYLVGDIVDGWNAGPSWYWSDAQKAVVQEIGRRRHRGVQT